MHFLFNDTVLDVDPPMSAPSEVSARASTLGISRVLTLVMEQVAAQPNLARTAPKVAARAAQLIMLKEPEVNAVLFIAPRAGCGVAEVSWRFASVDPLIMHELKEIQDRGALTPGTANAYVWSPAQTAAAV